MKLSVRGNLTRSESMLKFTPNGVRVVRGNVVTAGEWYELRVTGSVGTSTGVASGTGEGIAVGENGRLCAVTSGGARRFESKQEALEYLGKIRVSGHYEFEPVLCGARAAS